MKARARGTGRRGLPIVLVGVAALGAFLVALGAAAWPSERYARTEPADALARARRLLDDGRVSEAMAICRNELRLDPKNLRALRLAAMCARDAGDDEEVCRYLNRLVALAPDDAAAHRQLALALHRLGRDMEALSAAQTAMALSPESDAAMNELVTQLAMALAAPRDPLAASQTPGMPRRPQPSSPPDPLKHLHRKNPY